MTVTPKTPYGFIPLPDHVFFPDWAEKITHDIPFSDSCCGTIEFTIRAETPIFIRDGHGKDKLTSLSAQTPDGKFYIPATSIKGEIQNVLRILSFSKMGKYLDSSFGQRDLTNAGQDYREKIKNVRCGFLKMTPDGLLLSDHGIPFRIRIADVGKHFGVYFDNLKLAPAKNKYDLLKRKGYSEKDMEIKFIPDRQIQDKSGRKIVVIAKTGGEKGTIVLTGQPNKKKKYDFVFPETEEKTYPISDTLFQAFKSVHSSSVDFTEFREKELKKGKRIPVFFTLKAKENKVATIGLSYMHKIPYACTVRDGVIGFNKEWQKIAPDFEDKHPDLTDCIFGFIGKTDSLKGRVQFGHAKVVNEPKILPKQAFYSSSPRASFFPFYVKDGMNWNEIERIAGYKRYPPRISNSTATWAVGSSKMVTYAQFLDKGAVFHETIHFHNLRRVELGALLSAITFHNNQDTCFHSLGFGKPLGYGKISIKDLKLQCNGQECNGIPYMVDFEKEMTDFEKRWISSPQLKELLLMAKGIPVQFESSFEYMQLDDFKELKKQEYSLPVFSERVRQRNFCPKSLLNNE